MTSLNELKKSVLASFDEKFGSHSSLGFHQSRGREACRAFLEQTITQVAESVVQEIVPPEESNEYFDHQGELAWKEGWNEGRQTTLTNYEKWKKGV